MLRTNFARRAAGQDVEPLGRSAESKQLLVKDQIADLRWTYATRLSAGGVADKWVTQLLPRSSATIESLATPAGRRRAVSPVQSTDLVPPASSPWRLKKGGVTRVPPLGRGNRSSLIGLRIQLRPTGGLPRSDVWIGRRSSRRLGEASPRGGRLWFGHSFSLLPSHRNPSDDRKPIRGP